MPETLCPNCGHSPIPSGAEACPQCHEPFGFLQMHKRGARRFVDKARDHEEMEATVFGGNLTGEVTAHPGFTVALLFAGAAAWFLRAGGILGHQQEPLWAFGLVVLDLVLGLLVLVNAGPARLLTQLGMLVQLAAAAWLGRSALLAPVHVAWLAHAVVTFVMVTGEPGPARRYACLGLGLGALAAGLLFLVVPVGQGASGGGERQLLVGRELGFQLELPTGWARLGREQVEPHLALPAATLTGSAVAFGDVAQGRYGVLWVDRAPGQELIGGCEALLKALGGGAGKPLARAAPVSLGSKALVYELRAAGGAQGSLGCGQMEDGRLVGLAVVAASPEGGVGEAAFAAVGAGLALQ